MARRRRTDRVKQYEHPTYLGIKDRLARNVRRQRDSRAWSQEEAAQRCGMSTRLFQRIEAADANLTLTTLARLSVGFDVDIARLFARRR